MCSGLSEEWVDGNVVSTLHQKCPSSSIKMLDVILIPAHITNTQVHYALRKITYIFNLFCHMHS